MSSRPPQEGWVPHDTKQVTYKVECIMCWIETNGYKIVGPNREVYLYCTQPVRQDNDSYVTEIQFPIEKM